LDHFFRFALPPLMAAFILASFDLISVFAILKINSGERQAGEGWRAGRGKCGRGLENRRGGEEMLCVERGVGEKGRERVEGG
jgi:hypothetical protein